MLLGNELRVYEAAHTLAQRLPDDSRHTVAAAAMDTTGVIHTGVNVFHFTGGPCAELVLLGAAAARSAGPLMTIAAMGRADRGVIAPCGRCRQVLLDQHPDVMVIVPGSSDPDIVPIRDLLPYAYQPPNTQTLRVVRFSSRYHDDIAAGRKTVTIRHHDPVAVGPAIFAFEEDAGFRRLNGVIDCVERRRFDQLTKQEAQQENLDTLDDLRARLRGHYPEILDADDVDVVTFHITTVSA